VEDLIVERYIFCLIFSIVIYSYHNNSFISSNMSLEGVSPNTYPRNKHTPEVTKVPHSPERDAVFMESKIKRYALFTESIEEQINQINE